MADVNNRPVVPPPGREKASDVLSSAQVISRTLSGVIRRIDRLLRRCCHRGDRDLPHANPLTGGEVDCNHRLEPIVPRFISCTPPAQ